MSSNALVLLYCLILQLRPRQGFISLIRWMGFDPEAAKSQPGQFIWVTSTLGRDVPHLSWKPLGRINTIEAKQSKTTESIEKVGYNYSLPVTTLNDVLCGKYPYCGWFKKQIYCIEAITTATVFTVIYEWGAMTKIIIFNTHHLIWDLSEFYFKYLHYSYAADQP